MRHCDIALQELRDAVVFRLDAFSLGILIFVGLHVGIYAFDVSFTIICLVMLALEVLPIVFYEAVLHRACRRAVGNTGIVVLCKENYIRFIQQPCSGQDF